MLLSRTLTSSHTEPNQLLSRTLTESHIELDNQLLAPTITKTNTEPKTSSQPIKSILKKEKRHININEEYNIRDTFEIDDGHVIKKVDYSKQHSIPLGRVSQRNEYYTTDSIRKYINDKWKAHGYLLK
jgi:hypothetical protein